MLVDTHAHLEFTDDLSGWLERAKEAEVRKIITVGTSIEASKKCVEIADPPSHKATEGQEKIPEIFATVGIHPQDGKGDVEKFGDGYINELRTLLTSSSRVVAIGECGFDIHLVTSHQRPVTSDEEKGVQKELFAAQVRLASELKLPLVVHCRNGWEETFETIENLKLKNENLKGVFHSWTGDWEAAKKALDLGFYISFSGIVTFKNAPKVLEVAKKMPIERMLLETDSPFLSPEPLRSEYYKGSNPTSPRKAGLRGAHMRNEPKNVRIIGEFLSVACNVPFEELSDVTSRNAEKLFSL